MGLPPERGRSPLKPPLAWHAQAARFLVSGGVSTLAHWAVMGLLIQTGVQAMWATTAGAMAGSALNYALQYRWTFNISRTHRHTVPRYACVVIAGWCANGWLFHALVSALHLGIVPAQCLTSAVVAGVNFLLYKRIVFHERLH